jgi:hypothetical protein
MRAIKENMNLDIIKVFLSIVPSGRVNINATDSVGNTALHYAYHHYHRGNVTPLLIEAGIDTSIKNRANKLATDENAILFKYGKIF